MTHTVYCSQCGAELKRNCPDGYSHCDNHDRDVASGDAEMTEEGGAPFAVAAEGVETIKLVARENG